MATKDPKTHALSSPESVKQENPPVQSARDEEHMDDFLNHMEATEGKRELLAGFAAYVKRRDGGAVKRTREEWLAAFRAFENAIPE